MPLLTVKVDSSLARQLLGEQQRQVGYAMAVAVNIVGEAAQVAERAHLAHAFTLRRPDFINRESVKRLSPKPTKANPVFVLGPSDRASFLMKFEDGGAKRPAGTTLVTRILSRAGLSASKSVAIPIDVKRTKKDLISDRNKPRALLDSKAAQSTPAGLGKVFVVRPGQSTMHGGHPLRPGIYQSIGTKKAPGLRLLYLFKPLVRIDNRLHLYDTVEKAVADGWDKAVTDAVAKALATAR